MVAAESLLECISRDLKVLRIAEKVFSMYLGNSTHTNQRRQEIWHQDFVYVTSFPGNTWTQI